MKQRNNGIVNVATRPTASMEFCIIIFKWVITLYRGHICAASFLKLVSLPTACREVVVHLALTLTAEENRSKLGTGCFCHASTFRTTYVSSISL
jgi:hypothetical protein